MGLFADNTSDRRTRIKICGVCRAQDAAFAAQAGADAIGIVCTPVAGRYVPLEAAAEIRRSVPDGIDVVTLFVNQPIEEVMRVQQAIDASCVQLHGAETPEFVAKIDCNVIKAIRVDRETFERELNEWRNAIASSSLPNLRGFVLESPGPGIGGTGQRNDWTFVGDVAARGGFAGLPPIIAAGGLSPDNVGEVIQAIRPAAVDVSSGVERVKREKSPELIERFFSAVRDADQREVTSDKSPQSPSPEGRGSGVF
jgi:phosphoribosylanthranilate isomerase